MGDRVRLEKPEQHRSGSETLPGTLNHEGSAQVHLLLF